MSIVRPYLMRVIFVLSPLMTACLVALALAASAHAGMFDVLNLNDAGGGSLRQALADSPGDDSIIFEDALSGTITLQSALWLTDSKTFVNAEDINLYYSSDNIGDGALRIDAGETIRGSLPGDITVTGRNLKHALYGSGSFTLADGVSGTVSATATVGDAETVKSENDLSIMGDISGSILANAPTRSAAAIRANNEITLSSVSGSVVAKAKDAYAIDGGGHVAIGDLSGSIEAVGSNTAAYGISAGFLDIISQSGDISAHSGGDWAYGIHSLGTVGIGQMEKSASITATAAGREAYGVYASGTVVDRNLAGSVSATGATGVNGWWNSGDFRVEGILSGDISASATGIIARGIRSGGDMRIKNLSGSVAASSYGYASALVSKQLLYIPEDLSGDIVATSANSRAFGLEIEDAIEIGAISGSITATAGGADAFGIYSRAGGINTSIGCLDLSGTVSATAHGRAVAISAPQGMDINISGIVRAIDTSGGGDAYAIRSGAVDRESGQWIPDGGVLDLVILGNGAEIVGKIDLGCGTNNLAMDGAGTLNGAVSNITNVDKRGAGTWDTTGGISTHNLTVQDGTLKVNVTQTASPSVQVANNFVNNGEVAFALGGLVRSGQSFRVLSSAHLSGSGIYSSSSPMLSVDVDGSNINLTKKSYFDIVDRGNLNAVALANALDPLTGTATGDMADVLVRLESSASPQEFNAILEELGGILPSGTTIMSLGTAHQLALATQTRMAQMRTYQIMAQNDDVDPDDPESWPMVASNGDLAGVMFRESESRPNGVHLRMLGRTGTMQSHGGYAGYDHRSMIVSGGYDRVLSDGFLAGVSGGYARTDADYKDAGESDSTLDSYSLGLYGTWFDDAWYVDTVIAGAYNEYDANRRIAALGRTAISDSSGYTLSAKNAVGYRFDVGDYGLTPTASLEYTRFHQNGYTESGAGAANLTLPDVDSNFLESGLGVKVDRAWKTDFGQLIPELSAMWMHEWFTQDRELTVSMTGMPGTAFSQTTAETARDNYRFGAGVRAINDNGLSFSLRYQGDVEEHASSHSLACEAQFVF